MSLTLPDRESVRAEIERLGPPDAFSSLIAVCNAVSRGPVLDNGRELARARAFIYDELMAHWAEEQHRTSGYDRPFAVVALGGTGRLEMTPCSDTDYAFLFDDVVEGNQFLAELQRQCIHTSEFRFRCGFGGETLPFNLDDMPELEDKQLNSFADLRPVYDPGDLTPRFRERIRDTYDPFEHFLHVSEAWRHRWGELDSSPEQIRSFDIKNEGLRVFLAGIWSLAGREFLHSHDVYHTISDPRDLEAYGFLLRIRAFIHLRRGTTPRPSLTGNHPEDILDFDDFLSFGEMLGDDTPEQDRYAFANEVREKLLDARRRVDRFTWGVIGRELRNGRRIRPGSAIHFGVGGLRDAAFVNRETPRQRSRAALTMLVASQRYGLPIHPSEMDTTFRDAGDWLVPVPELGELFYEPRGSLADSLKFLSQIPGALDRLFPGFGPFETSIDERVMAEQNCLRGAMMREKLRALENFHDEGTQELELARNPHEWSDPAFEISIPVETALLDDDHLSAVRLALVTKRLPETEDDIAARADESLPLHERFASGFSRQPLERYYRECFADCHFSDETLEITEFLVANRRVLKSLATRLLTEPQVSRFVDLCGEDEFRLRALFVFTCADRSHWESARDNPARWFNIRELYAKARMRFRPAPDPTQALAAAGYGPDHVAVLEDFGADFFRGAYRHYALRFGGHLIRIKENAGTGEKEVPPKASRIRIGTSEIIGVAAQDHPGIAGSISGELWRRGVGLQQAHLFSASRHGLALDFFHLAPPDKEDEGEAIPSPPPSDGDIPPVCLEEAVVRAIVERRHIGREDAESLPDVARNITLEAATGGLFHLRAETHSDTGALVYVLTCRAFLDLGADIHALSAHTGRGVSWVSVYLRLPRDLSLDQARTRIDAW